MSESVTKAYTLVLEVPAGSPWNTEEECGLIQMALREQLPLCRPQVRGGFCAESLDVGAFHAKYSIACAPVPSFLDEVMFKDRFQHVLEELAELQRAHDERDLCEVADALVDAVYALQGMATKMGLPWVSHWREVQRANMAKVAVRSASESKRGSAVDVVKPAGWVAPNHGQLIGEGPWPTFTVERLL